MFNVDIDLVLRFVFLDFLLSTTYLQRKHIYEYHRMSIQFELIFWGKRKRIGGITKVLQVNDKECCKKVNLITKKYNFIKMHKYI